MYLDSIAVLLTWISLVVAFVAAIIWIKASNIVIRKGDPKSRGTIFMQNVDVQSTATEQSRWNSRAALATAVALIAQGASQAISNWSVLAKLVG